MLRLLLLLCLLARPASAEPALWAVRGPHATVYLFGSVHLLPPDAAWEGKAVQRAVAAARAFWFELDFSATDKVGLFGTTLLSGFDFQHRITDELAPAAAEQLRQRFGDGIGKVEHLRPWLVLLMLATTEYTGSGYKPELGVDTVLRGQAVAAGKPVHGIESGAAQARLLAAIPDADALRSIETMLAAPPGQMRRQLEQLVRGWLAGRPVTLSASDDGVLGKRLLDDRNKVFADTVATLVRGDETVMVTVGAAHLWGKAGVPTLLRERGLRVERVR